MDVCISIRVSVPRPASLLRTPRLLCFACAIRMVLAQLFISTILALFIKIINEAPQAQIMQQVHDKKSVPYVRSCMLWVSAFCGLLVIDACCCCGYAAVAASYGRDGMTARCDDS